jgi:chromosome segregation ATPase
MNRHIDSIHIQDFQNHQDTHIKLVPGLNIITGSSDSGKSAIVRALDLAFLDTFRKQDVRDGQKNSHVTINFRNGDTYKRTKGDINELEFQYAGKEIQKHSRFSKKFPQEALDFLGHIPKTSTNALPFAGQEDKLFLINLSDEAIGKEISKLLGIYDLEEAATLLGSDINKLSVDIKRLNTDIENTKKKLEPFENLDLKLKTIEELKNLQSEYESTEQYIQDCESFLKHFLTLIKEINKCKSDLSVQNELLDFFTNEIPTLEHRYSEIKDGIQLVENIDNAKNNFFKSKIQYEKSYEIAEGQIGSLICDSIKLQTLYSGLYSIEKSIEEVNENIDFSSDKINDEEDIITACNDKIKILLEYLHANFTICETCGKPL